MTTTAREAAPSIGDIPAPIRELLWGWVEAAVARRDQDGPVPTAFELLPMLWPKILREPYMRDALAGYAALVVADAVLGVLRCERGEDDANLDDDLEDELEAD
jgi:hypothetical protein